MMTRRHGRLVRGATSPAWRSTTDGLAGHHTPEDQPEAIATAVESWAAKL